MSQPSFPEINSEMTREHALNMILTSIAMEELSLSHIINAEGEKLQYTLGTLNPCGGKRLDKPCIEDILAVNQSVTRLLEIVSQNQMLLKNKMDSVLAAMPDERCARCHKHPCACAASPCGCPEETPCPPYEVCHECEKCSAVFRGSRNFEIWREGCPFLWFCENIRGNCIICPTRENQKITLKQGRYMVGFAVNVKNRHNSSITVALKKLQSNRQSDVFSYHYPVSEPDAMLTASASGVIVEVPDNCGNISLFLELVTPKSLTVENAIFNIVKI